jgi:hypothetical protein
VATTTATAEADGLDEKDDDVVAFISLAEKASLLPYAPSVASHLYNTLVWTLKHKYKYTTTGRRKRIRDFDEGDERNGNVNGDDGDDDGVDDSSSEETSGDDDSHDEEDNDDDGFANLHAQWHAMRECVVATLRRPFGISRLHDALTTLHVFVDSTLCANERAIYVALLTTALTCECTRIHAHNHAFTNTNILMYMHVHTSAVMSDQAAVVGCNVLATKACKRSDMLRTVGDLVLAMRSLPQPLPVVTAATGGGVADVATLRYQDAVLSAVRDRGQFCMHACLNCCLAPSHCGSNTIQS